MLNLLLFLSHDSTLWASSFYRTDKVILQGLNKVTARVFTITALVGKEVHFQNLRILVKECRVPPPEDPPETLAFLIIEEERMSSKERHRVFEGWMFASNPSLHALEHPVYDVWVKEGGKIILGEKPKYPQDQDFSDSLEEPQPLLTVEKEGGIDNEEAVASQGAVRKEVFSKEGVVKETPERRPSSSTMTEILERLDRDTLVTEQEPLVHERDSQKELPEKFGLSPEENEEDS